MPWPELILASDLVPGGGPRRLRGGAGGYGRVRKNLEGILVGDAEAEELNHAGLLRPFLAARFRSRYGNIRPGSARRDELLNKQFAPSELLTKDTTEIRLGWSAGIHGGYQ